VPGLNRFCLESWNEPVALYESLKQRGMDLVTVTDHDSIDAVEQLRRYPRFLTERLVLGPEEQRSRAGGNCFRSCVMTLSQARTTLSAPDYRLMRRVNRWRAPQWVQWWMLLATKAGGGWLWGAVGAALLCSSDALRFRALEAAACAVAIGIVVFHKIKRRVCRPRPRDFEPHCWACIATKDKLSFPSGHTTTAFPVTLSIGSFYPEIMLALLILAANVAASRVILGMHFLSDVLAGAGMGALLGYIAFRFAA
jgi:undecaprenyl-diphosphatase